LFSGVNLVVKDFFGKPNQAERLMSKLDKQARHASHLLEMRADVFSHSVMPLGPFVAAFRAPVVEVMISAGAGKDFGHFVGGAGNFSRAGAGGEVDVAGRELFAEPGIMWFAM
jgi:hypothetical protein